MKVFYSQKNHLGDLWYSTSWLCKLAINEPVGFFYRAFQPDGDSKDVRVLISEILQEMEGGNNIRIVTDETLQMSAIPSRCWHQKLCSTHKKWNPKGSVVAYQLDDSRYKSSLKDLEMEEIHHIKKTLSLFGFETLKVGLPRTIKESVDILSQSTVFVGIDSGMSHIAYSVGVPVILVKNKIPDRMLLTHQNRYSVLCNNSIDFEKNLCNLLQDIGKMPLL